MRSVAAILAVLSCAAGILLSGSVARADDETDNLFKQVRALEAAGKFPEAMLIAERLEALTLKRFGEVSADHADALSWLGELDQDEGRFGEAERLLKRALNINEKALGPDHRTVGRDLNNLAMLYQDQGRFVEAEPLMRRALTIMQNALGANHQNVGTELMNLASVYRDEGRVAEAEPLLKRALEIEEKALGTGHPNVAPVLKNLALLYKEQDRFREAEPLFKRALAIDEKALGGDHPSVGGDLNNLAALYHNQGRLDEAEQLLKRALAIDERALGPDHPSVAPDLNHLGLVYRDQGRLADAEQTFKRALAIVEKALGPGHPRVGVALNNLALVYDDQGRLAEAEPLFKRALAIDEKALGPDHATVAILREDLGTLYLTAQKAAAAEPLLLAALRSDEKNFGVGSPETAYALSELGDLYRQLGDCERANGFFARAHNAGGSILGEIRVLFATDRTRDDKRAALTFSSISGTGLTLGSAAVVVPTDERRTQDLALRRAAAKTKNPEGASAQVTAVHRMALSCATVSVERQILAVASNSMATATHNPGQAIVYVHGFNNSFEDALRRAGQIGYDLRFDGPIFAFSWPSKNSVFGYLADAKSARDAAPALKDLLIRIIKGTGVRKIHFIAHSMGNVLLLDALQQLLKSDPEDAGSIGEIIDASPDIDPKEMKASVTAIEAKGPRFTIYASRNDWALYTSSILHALLDLTPAARAGFVGSAPLIIPGVDTLDVTNTGLYFGLNHDLYASNPTLVTDMRRLIGAGTRPPDKRNSAFEAVSIAEGKYWRLKAVQAAP